MTTNKTTARARALEVFRAAPIREGRFIEENVIDALLANPEVLRALAEQGSATVREWGTYDLRDDPNDPSPEVGGVDPADDEDDAQKIAASWSTGRVCWRDVTYGPWRTR